MGGRSCASLLRCVWCRRAEPWIMELHNPIIAVHNSNFKIMGRRYRWAARFNRFSWFSTKRGADPRHPAIPPRGSQEPLWDRFFSRRGIMCLWTEISYIWHPDATLIKQNARGTAADNRVNCNRIPRAAVYDIPPAPSGYSAGQKIALIVTGLNGE